jgi:hypothetical protein
VTTTLTSQIAPRATFRARRVFVPLAALAAAIAFVGFWPSYFGPLRDMIVFTPFLAAGWIYRRRPEIHKRCMLVATTILLVAAVGRMKFQGTPPPESLMLLVWPLPIYVAMLHDYATKRLIHPVYMIGILAMIAMRLVLPLRGTPTWLDFTAWLAGL